MIKLMRALMISAVRWKAVQPDLSSSFPCLGVPTILAMFAVLLSLVASETTAPLQTTNGCALNSTKQEVANITKMVKLHRFMWTV